MLSKETADTIQRIRSGEFVHPMHFGGALIEEADVHWALSEGLEDSKDSVRRFAAGLLLASSINFDAEECLVLKRRMEHEANAEVFAYLVCAFLKRGLPVNVKEVYERLERYGHLTDMLDRYTPKASASG